MTSPKFSPGDPAILDFTGTEYYRDYVHVAPRNNSRVVILEAKLFQRTGWGYRVLPTLEKGEGKFLLEKFLRPLPPDEQLTVTEMQEVTA